VQAELVEQYVGDEAFMHMDFLFEPDAAAILNSLLPSYLEMSVYRPSWRVRRASMGPA